MNDSDTQTERPSDTEVLDAIARVMSGTEWDSGTLETVADSIRLTGRTILDPNDLPQEREDAE